MPRGTTRRRGQISSQPARAPEMVAAEQRAEGILPASGLRPQPRVMFVDVPIDEFCDGRHRLPGFQRPAVWSAEKCHAYAKAVLLERRFPGLFVMRIRPTQGFAGGGPRDVLDVLDGQQRILALGGILQRGSIADVAAQKGEPVVGAAPHLNALARGIGEVLVPREATEQPPPLYTGVQAQRPLDYERLPPARLRRLEFRYFTGMREHIQRSGESLEFADAMSLNIVSILKDVRLPCLILHEKMSTDDVKGVFRAINTPGVSIGDDELERLLARDD